MGAFSALSPTQALVYTLLHGDTALHALAETYDYHVPPTASYPCVVLAELREELDETLGTDGRVVHVLIDCYSQAKGYKEVEDIAEAVIRLLNNDELGDPTGWHTESSMYASGALGTEIDGVTRHAELMFDVRLFK